MPQNAQALFNEISQFIAQSRRLLEAGAMMELVGLDKQVQILCDSVLKLSQGDRALYADRLQQLFDDLKNLGDEMAMQRDKLADEIRGVPSFQKAAVAYRVMGETKGIPDPDDDDE